MIGYVNGHCFSCMHLNYGSCTVLDLGQGGIWLAMLKDTHCDVQTDHIQIQALTAVEKKEGKGKERYQVDFWMLTFGLDAKVLIFFFLKEEALSAALEVERAALS